jgi:hypothetical protein
MATSQPWNIANEVIDFLVSSPTPEQIIAFHASDTVQDRLHTLLEANRNGTLTAHEKAELDEMSRVDHFFTLIKARTMKVLKDRQTATE